MLRDATVAHGRMNVSWKYMTAGVEIGSDGGTLADCRVTDCTAGNVGCMDGAVKILGADAVVVRCLIDGNSVERGAGWNNSCGGIYALAGRIESCVITNNVGSAFNYNNHDRKASGRPLVVGKGDPLNVTGLADFLVDRDCEEVPASPGWASEGACHDWRKMCLDYAGKRYPLRHNANCNGNGKAVCAQEVQLAEGIEPIAYLDNGKPAQRRKTL